MIIFEFAMCMLLVIALSFLSYIVIDDFLSWTGFWSRLFSGSLVLLTGIPALVLFVAIVHDLINLIP